MTIQSLIGTANTPPLACSPQAHLMTGVARRVTDGANAIAVTGSCGQLAGILSDQDIIRALHGGSGSAAHAIVETWMTRNVITVTPERAARRGRKDDGVP
ncbi:MAG: CBS domain-containing protein [Hyphomonas sp.]|uniref:CBS domain-containing protein n=1 Tax=Hyphomonas sp. TaxID=87 RepID=UPI0034A001F7